MSEASAIEELQETLRFVRPVRRKDNKYPRYKESGVPWLGELPEHWVVVRLKQFMDIQNGSDHKHLEQAYGYPVFGSGGIFAYASDFLYDGESVLLGRKGTINKPLYVTGRFWTVDTMYWTKISPKVSGRFTYYLALTIPFNYYSTNTALPSMTKENLNSHVVTRPTLQEQITITSFLDHQTAKIDALIEKKKQLMELLKEKRMALISRAVTRGLDSNVKMKDSGVEWLGEVPVHWNVLRTKFICSIDTGSRNTEDSRDEGEYPFFVRSDNIERINTWSFDGEAVLTSGDGAGVGKVFHHYVGRMEIHQRVYLYYAFKNILARFFYHFLKSNLYKVVLDGAAKSTVDSLRRPILQNFWVTVPPESDQLTIVKFVDEQNDRISNAIEKVQAGLIHLQEYRTALISAAVTGKIDVRDWKAP